MGKSSMLNFISDALKDRNEDKTYLFVNFNAWLYQGYDDARAALLESIASKLVESAADDENALVKAKKFMSRVNWFRALGLAAGSLVPMVAGLPPVGLLGAISTALQRDAEGSATGDAITALTKSGEKIVEAGKEVIMPKNEETPQEQIHALREQFESTLEAMNATLVVFIDDLDRCLPATAISTLEAVRLFLFLPQTAFVIAADDKMIRRAVRAHFEGVALDDDLVTNYFDKLIQIPLRVLPLGTQEVRAYLMLLYLSKSGLDKEKLGAIRSKVCERLSTSWTGTRVDLDFMTGLIPNIDAEVQENLELANRLAPLMTTAQHIRGNPRLIKRF